MPDMMEYRFLGRTGLKVSVLSFGGWITQGKQIKDDIAIDCIRLAYDSGINFFDSAEVYAAGGSEQLLGTALKKLSIPRSKVVISTKIYWGGPGVNERGLSRKHIIEGTKASLQRLQLDYVDLIFAHRPDEQTPMEEVVRAFNYLIDKGQAMYWGTSEWSAEQISEAIAVANQLSLVGPAMEQPQYNMFCRERFEKEYAPIFKKYGLGTTIWSPLASGILTGKYINGIPPDSRLALKGEPYLERHRQELQSEIGRQKNEKVKQLQSIAEELGATVSQLAIAWCIRNSNVSSVILGASKVSQLQENLKALEIVPKLGAEVLKSIEQILNNAPELPPARF
jgi:voltage-dependent potassium channel beta subunit